LLAVKTSVLAALSPFAAAATMVRNKKWEWTEGDDRRLLENEGGWQILDFDCREVEGNPRVIDGRLSILRKQIAEGQDPLSAAGPTVNKPK